MSTEVRTRWPTEPPGCAGAGLKVEVEPGFCHSHSQLCPSQSSSHPWSPLALPVWTVSHTALLTHSPKHSPPKQSHNVYSTHGALCQNTWGFMVKSVFISLRSIISSILLRFFPQFLLFHIKDFSFSPDLVPFPDINSIRLYQEHRLDSTQYPCLGPM